MKNELKCYARMQKFYNLLVNLIPYGKLETTDRPSLHSAFKTRNYSKNFQIKAGT